MNRPSTPAPPPFDLERFTAAQAPIYAQVCEELQAGAKTTHWMWFIFPQLRGLGLSPTATFFGLDGSGEAAAYWHHPVLGERLLHCTRLVLQVQGRSAHDIFSSPDDLKLRSCMTLFDAVATPADAFAQVLDRYFGGIRDPRTRQMLGLPGT